MAEPTPDPELSLAPAIRSHAESTTPMGLASIVIAVLCAALWGGTVVAIKISVDSIPPFGAAGIRFFLGAICMFIWCRWKGYALLPRPGQFRPMAIAGVMLYAQIGLLNLATSQTTASNAVLLLNLYPIFVVALAHFLHHDDRLTKRTSIGLIVSLLGVFFILRPTDPSSTLHDLPSLQGDLIALASALVLAVRVMYTKRILTSVGSGQLLFWHDLVAVLLFAATTTVFEGFSNYDFTTPAVISLLYQGLVVAGFCYAAWTALLQKHRASQLVVFGFITPLCGVVFSHLLRGDVLGLGLILGGIAIVAGVVLVNTQQS